MKKKTIKPDMFPEESFADGYSDYVEDILDRVIEPFVWSLCTDGSPRIDEILKQGATLADRVRPQWRAAASDGVSVLESLPEWTIDLFRNSYVGRQAAYLGAMERDEVSFVVLLLQAIFAVEALQKVCEKHPTLAEKYASRFQVWPWFVSDVSNFQQKLRRQLEMIGFASQTSKKHKMGSAITKPEAAEVMAMLLWFRFVANSWDEKQAENHPLLKVLQTMPERGQQSNESIALIIIEAVKQFAKDIYTRKLNLPHGKYSKRYKSSNEKDLERTVSALFQAFLRPEPEALKATKTRRPRVSKNQ